MAAKHAFVEGIAMWTKVTEGQQDTKFKPNGEWQITLIVTKDISKKFLNAGLISKEKQNDDGDYLIDLKKPCVSASGQKLEPPKVYDTDGIEIDGSTIGNGSKVKVKVLIYEYNNSFGSGLTTHINEIKVLDLVEYNPDTEDFFGENDDY